ncbi:divergent PAP2 family protein [Alicyclobacillus acidocaldarius]|uniref:Acid phosphatase/vanadium-dependent haloperoxidase related protein n=1 Tax=Alicyclobacillus acidocaldarius (strain Tc-4-1) TaxID=1048834 RepID=F8IGD6_ALIAT|nr:divergent PAP2 family protein [Alicyclobacillus acidocaldarius]AEJ43032.1 acid phosphatase/vanadium-dependent haloperoxidase related protein [Alicyclobacillus acidocaldarius subsp. acidocaldarius Tc-4-1]
MPDLLHFLQGLWGNTALMAAICAIVVTQILKVPIHYVTTRAWDWSRAFGAGGMPSSHSAGVVALASALWFVVGPGSPIFAVAVVFAAIVMYDAGGIRRHAGEHAVLLNRIAMEFSQRSESAVAGQAEGERLKEILGHEPAEIVVGGLIGLVIGIVFGRWW